MEIYFRARLKMGCVRAEGESLGLMAAIMKVNSEAILPMVLEHILINQGFHVQANGVIILSLEREKPATQMEVVIMETF